MALVTQKLRKRNSIDGTYYVSNALKYNILVGSSEIFCPRKPRVNVRRD
jgi:hypothetical protein|tara:strand:+ start:201 stop:347 length:147 start_codon:yes stop_codon:yes gene_type:complete